MPIEETFRAIVSEELAKVIEGFPTQQNSEPPHVNIRLLEEYRPGWNIRKINEMERKYGRDLPFIRREGRTRHILLKELDEWVKNEGWNEAGDTLIKNRHQKNRYQISGNPKPPLKLVR